MNRKILFLLLLAGLFCCLPLIAQESESTESKSDIDVYVLRTGMRLSMLKVNDYSYFSLYGDAEARVLEITPIDEKVCKMVVAVPWNRAGSFLNYVIYLNSGDMIQMLQGSTVAIGLVGAFEYNKVPFLGIAK